MTERSTVPSPQTPGSSFRHCASGDSRKLSATKAPGLLPARFTMPR